MQYPFSGPQRAWWFPAVALVLVVALTWAPVVAAGVSAAGAQPEPRESSLDAGIELAKTSRDEVAPKFDGADPSAGRSLVRTVSKRTSPVPKREPAAKATRRVAQATRRAVLAKAPRERSSNATTTHRTRPRSTKRTATVARTRTVTRTTTSVRKKKASSPYTAPTASRDSDSSDGDELSQARSILASLVSQHPILSGTTVSIGATPGGYQAVAYFKSGRILISPNHRASLSTILRHEVWHVIDWRDNQHIDWGENIPPS